MKLSNIEVKTDKKGNKKYYYYSFSQMRYFPLSKNKVSYYIKNGAKVRDVADNKLLFNRGLEEVL